MPHGCPIHALQQKRIRRLVLTRLAISCVTEGATPAARPTDGPRTSEVREKHDAWLPRRRRGVLNSLDGTRIHNFVEVSGFTFLRPQSDFALVWRNAGPAAPAGRRGLTFDIDRSG